MLGGVWSVVRLADKNAKCAMVAYYWLFLSILVAEYLSPCSVHAQAPGDEDDFCLEISTAPAYAASVKPLLDSWRYQTLLGSDGVWDTLSLDNDDIGVRMRDEWLVDCTNCERSFVTAVRVNGLGMNIGK